MPAIGQTADGPGQKLPAAGGFPFALLGFARDADGGEFVPVAVEPAGESQAERAGIEFVGLALAVQGDGRDQKALRAGGHERAMQHEAEPATFLHAADLETLGDPFFGLGDELFGGVLAGGVRIGVVSLRHRHNEFEVHVQTKLEQGLGRVNNGRGQWLARRQVPCHCGLVSGRSRGYGWGCRDGFKNVFFH